MHDVVAHTLGRLIAAHPTLIHYFKIALACAFVPGFLFGRVYLVKLDTRLYSFFNRMKFQKCEGDAVVWLIARCYYKYPFQCLLFVTAYLIPFIGPLIIEGG